MDSDGIGIVGIILGLMIAIAALYVLALALSAVAGTAAAGGAVFGCGKALQNYGESFRENVIESNRMNKAA